MEVLDEFDSEFPQTVTFCQLISEEDFERQAATYTERALRRLFRSLDRNPALAERVVRKGKQAECERRGLLSFLWAKASCAVQGELNGCNSMSALEMHQRLEQLKRRIHRVHLYSQGPLVCLLVLLCLCVLDGCSEAVMRCQEEEEEAETEETRAHRLGRPRPAPSPAAACATAAAHGPHGGPATRCLHYAQGLWPLPSAAQHIAGESGSFEPHGRPDPPGPQSWGLPLLVPDQEQCARAPLPLDLSLQ
ncbi:uncharacterized protein LOC102393963 isoform X4 [Bubalus bubalis]|uniref:uncharacterized protein LOC102393963 isoform X4 n=1 Tax=Bubalus bubalis TaxID=89462 RepID=UPI001D122E5C|nr:uncharacterized protein LOC102393963 isoform X4 [Bubalus bubalis]